MEFQEPRSEKKSTKGIQTVGVPEISVAGTLQGFVGVLTAFMFFSTNLTETGKVSGITFKCWFPKTSLQFGNGILSPAGVVRSLCPNLKKSSMSLYGARLWNMAMISPYGRNPATISIQVTPQHLFTPTGRWMRTRWHTVGTTFWKDCRQNGLINDFLKSSNYAFKAIFI